jgi:hypothetical protein
MRYLKTFEGFGHLDFTESLFKQIDYEQFEECTSSRILSSEVDEVSEWEFEWFIGLLNSNLVNPIRIVRCEKVKRHYSDDVYSVIRVFLEPKINSEHSEMLLYKFEDDYWVLESMGTFNNYFDGGSDWTYWVCDTKDGLVKLIEYYFNNIKEWLSPVTESLSNGESIYYEISEINPDEKEFVGLDQSVVNKIVSRLLPGFILEKKNYNFFKNSILIGYSYYVINLPDTDFYFDIFQLDDEYFDVEYLDTRNPSYNISMFNSHYYRCDGVEGLLQFLQDENIIE